jgi:5'-3' exonuclease
MSKDIITNFGIFFHESKVIQIIHSGGSMKSQQPKILLVDSMALLFRGFYATAVNGPIMQTTYGLYTNGVYQFTRYLLDAIRKFSPTHVACAFDMGKETFRNELFPEYKSNRGEPPVELLPQFDLLRSFVGALDVPVLGLKGYEADDVLGTLSKRFSAEGAEVLILTGDGDTLQLLDVHTSVIMMRKGFGHYEKFTQDNLKEKKNIDHPSQIIELKALMGDASDFIPGCPGVGPKTAEKLISEFGSVDVLFEKIDDVKGKLKEKLVAHKEQIYLSRDLATIRTDVPVECHWSDCEWRPNPVKILEKLDELEFSSLRRYFTA